MLELFSGSQCMTNVFKEKGWETFTVDNGIMFTNKEKQEEILKITDLNIDIMELTSEKILQEFGQPDVIWLSPPCQKFSVASIGKYWISGTNLPKTEESKQALQLLEHTINLVKELNPKLYFMENPRGKMRKMDCVQDLTRHTLTYCGYGDDRMKPTDIWTNHPNPQFKPACKNGDPCHVAAPRGSRTGTQGRASNWERAVIPHQLCEHIEKVSREYIGQYNLIDNICNYTIQQVQEESNCDMSGFQYPVEFSWIESEFNIKIDENNMNDILELLKNRIEVADVIVEDNCFDVVLYTDYAPNYIEDKHI